MIVDISYLLKSFRQSFVTWIELKQQESVRQSERSLGFIMYYSFYSGLLEQYVKDAALLDALAVEKNPLVVQLM